MLESLYTCTCTCMYKVKGGDGWHCSLMCAGAAIASTGTEHIIVTICVKCHGKGQS